MKILITGNGGLVGHAAYKRFRAEHQVLCLEKNGSFADWIYDLKYKTSWAFNYDVVLHLGAISANQYPGADIFLWNSVATKLLAEHVRNPNGTIPYFIFFSSTIVKATEKDLSNRTNYGWSKWMAENYLREVYRDRGSADYCILCPTVIWGEGERWKYAGKSIPYQLATHTLEYLLKDYSRDYIHVDDVIDAIEHCIENRVVGKYELSSGKTISNKEIAEYTDWKGYQFIDDPLQMGYNQITRHVKSCDQRLPDWEPSTKLSVALRKLEREYQNKEY